MLAAVNKNGVYLQFASAELKGDREVVLAAVKKNGYNLRIASTKLQGDREFILDLIKSNDMYNCFLCCILVCVFFGGYLS